jgi:hypothetical protein
MACIKPVGEVSLLWEPWQFRNHDACRFAGQGTCDRFDVLPSILIVISKHDNMPPRQSIGVFLTPLFSAHRVCCCYQTFRAEPISIFFTLA